MHTRISPADLSIWIFLVAAQGGIAFSLRRSNLAAVRNFLYAETLLGITEITLSRTIGAWPYFRSWICAVVVHQALAALLLLPITNQIRLRALPWRRSVLPIQFMVAVSFGLGISSSSVALRALAAMPYWKIILTWDHAFWYAVCGLTAFLPLYAWAAGSSIPRQLALVLAGLGLYAVCNTGLLAYAITHHKIRAAYHLPDAVYCLTLLSWLLASRMKHPAAVPETAQTLVPYPVSTEQQI